jgi:Flp pilus assembly pilin Flp
MALSCLLGVKGDRMLTLLFLKIYDDDRGASMVEYSLLVVLIALVALVAVSLAGNEVSESYSEIASAVETGP